MKLATFASIFQAGRDAEQREPRPQLPDLPPIIITPLGSNPRGIWRKNSRGKWVDVIDKYQRNAKGQFERKK